MRATTRTIRAIICAALLLAFAACGEKGEQAGGPGDAEIAPVYSEQAQMIETALKDDPRNAELLIQLGNLYYDWGESDVRKKGDLAQPADKWTKAVEYYRRALEQQPKNVNVRVDMATLMRYIGRVDQAVAEYRTAISQDPKHPQARINLILALGQAKEDYKAAVSEYEALIKSVPEQKDNQTLRQEVDSFKAKMKEARK